MQGLPRETRTEGLKFLGGLALGKNEPNLFSVQGSKVSEKGSDGFDAN